MTAKNKRMVGGHNSARLNYSHSFVLVAPYLSIHSEGRFSVCENYGVGSEERSDPSDFAALQSNFVGQP